MYYVCTGTDYYEEEHTHIINTKPRKVIYYDQKALSSDTIIYNFYFVLYLYIKKREKIYRNEKKSQYLMSETEN